MEIKRVKVKYETGHEIKFKYKKDNDLHCPSCGNKGIWIENSEGDFYEGPNHVCINCNNSFTIPSIGKEDEQLVKQLK